MMLPPIRSIVPQSGPMVLLDRVVSVGPETLCAEVAIHGGSAFCEADGVGSWVGIEYMAQTIAAFAGYEASLRGEPVKIGFLLGSRRYECAAPLFTLGSVLHIHAERSLQSESGLGSFACRITDATSGAELATGTITVFQPENHIEIA